MNQQEIRESYTQLIVDFITKNTILKNHQERKKKGIGEERKKGERKEGMKRNKPGGAIGSHSLFHKEIRQ